MAVSTARHSDHQGSAGLRQDGGAVPCAALCADPDPDGLLVQQRRSRHALGRLSACTGTARRSTNEEFHNAAKNTHDHFDHRHRSLSTLIATMAAIGMTRVKPWRGIGPSLHGHQPAADGAGDHHGGRDAVVLRAAGRNLRPQSRHRQSHPGAYGVLHSLCLYADPRPARGHGPDAGKCRGRSLCHAMERLPAGDAAAAGARHPVRGGAGLHRVVRRFHHHAAGGRTRPDDAAALYLESDPAADDAGDQRHLDDPAC